MSTPIKKPPSVNTSQDPGLEYLNQREIDVVITPTENSTKSVVYEEVTKVITNIFQVNAPTGANGQLQFNQNGQYVGDAELNYNPNTDTLSTGTIVANNIRITGNASSLKLNGGNNNDVLKTDGNGNLSWGNVFPSVAGNTGKFLVTNGVSINWSNVNYNSLATTTFVSSAIANLVGTAPAMLDTLGEIANIIGQTNDPQFGIISQLANKANISNLAQVAFSGSYSDLSYKPTISTAGRTGNYSDLNGKPTIPATITDLGISDGSNGQVLTTYGNGKYHFTTVTSGSNANIGNIGFDNNIIYSNTGVVINNSDLGNGQTAGMAIPVQGDGNAVSLYNAYGNVNILAGNIGNSQPVQAWTFNSAGALFFPQTPYVTSGIVVDDNNQELSIGTDRGNISIWPENSKWLFSADGTTTFPNNVISQHTGIDLSVATATASSMSATVVNGGSGYGNGGSQSATSGGSGTGLIVSYGYGMQGQVSNIGILNPGSGYQDGDILTMTAGNGNATFVLHIVPQINNSWTFGADGNLTVPGGGVINDDGSANAINIVGSSYAQLQSNDSYVWVENGQADIQVNGYGWTFHDDAVLTIANGANISQTTDNGGQKTFNITPPETSDFEVVLVDGNARIQSDGGTWTFGKDGDLVLPEGKTIRDPAGADLLAGSGGGSALLEPYKGFRAEYGSMYDNYSDPNGPINKLVIYRDTVTPTSTIDTSTSSDDFQVTGLAGSDIVVMLVVISNNVTQTSTVVLREFVESVIDNVIIDGNTPGNYSYNDIATMKSLFYSNFNNFKSIIPSVKTNLEFFDNSNWPSNYINDGGDDEYDGANYINTDLANGLSYNNGDVVSGSSEVGGGDYVVTYQDGIFGFFITNANIDSIGTSGQGGYGSSHSSSGFDGDGIGVTGGLYGGDVPAPSPIIATWKAPSNNTWRIETYNGGAAVSYNGSDYDAKWFDVANSPSGNNDFRGAVIEYHAFIPNRGTIIGTIHLSNDETMQEATHTEHMSGDNQIQFMSLWTCNNEYGQLYFKRTDGSSESLMIQWTAKIFYGNDYWY